MTELDAAVPLAEAQEWLRNRVADGEKCPCCSQFAKVYRRRLTSATGRVLIGMWRAAGTGWVDVPRLGVLTAGRGDECKARYWGLIEAMPDVARDDGSSRVGMWRLTELGVAFVQDLVTVAKYARVYDGRLLGLDDAEQVSITDVLGARFNYRELMDT